MCIAANKMTSAVTRGRQEPGWFCQGLGKEAKMSKTPSLTWRKFTVWRKSQLRVTTQTILVEKTLSSSRAHTPLSNELCARCYSETGDGTTPPPS